MALIGRIVLWFFHIFHLLNNIISLFNQRLSVIFLTNRLVRLNWHIFTWRLSCSFCLTSVRASIRPLRWRFYSFSCRKWRSRRLLMLVTYMRTIVRNLVRWLFHNATFRRCILNSSGFGKCSSNELLHGIFILFHIRMSHTHFLWNRLPSCFIVIWNCLLWKIACLCCMSMTFV